MGKKSIHYTAHFDEVIKKLQGSGLLLVTAGKDGKPNVMTIGWGTIGEIWHRPIFIVMVRHSRYTFTRLEEINEFTVNVPAKELAKAVAYCGTVSGSHHDKFAEMKLIPVPGKKVKVPIIEQCIMHYECKILHYNEIIPENLDKAVIKEAYPKGDFHRVYFGEILTSYADEDIEQRLKQL